MYLIISSTTTYVSLFTWIKCNKDRRSTEIKTDEWYDCLPLWFAIAWWLTIHYLFYTMIDWGKRKSYFVISIVFRRKNTRIRMGISFLFSFAFCSIPGIDRNLSIISVLLDSCSKRFRAYPVFPGIEVRTTILRKWFSSFLMDPLG